jgi:hypothetical protein
VRNLFSSAPVEALRLFELHGGAISGGNYSLIETVGIWVKKGAAKCCAEGARGLVKLAGNCGEDGSILKFGKTGMALWESEREAEPRRENFGVCGNDLKSGRGGSRQEVIFWSKLDLTQR